MKGPILFSRALMDQCLGTLRGMRAIRAVIPSAHFLQTEDLGKVFSTRPLRYQAAYENERRWLSLDMLSGRVEQGHRFHDALLCSEIGRAHVSIPVPTPQLVCRLLHEIKSHPRSD